jgi:hypothetical protein
MKARPRQACRRQKPTARPKAVRSFARHSGPLPAVDPLLSAVYTITDRAALRVHHQHPHASRCLAFAPPFLHASRARCSVPGAQSTNIPALTLGASVLHNTRSLFDRPPRRAPVVPHSAFSASQEPTVSFGAPSHDIGCELTRFPARAHHERAPADKTEHITNSS